MSQLAPAEYCREESFDSHALRRALSCFATGVTVVTACGPDDTRVGLTANSFNSVSLDLPLVLWSLSLRAPSLPIFSVASHFAVNVLADDQAELARRFATPLPDKFAGLTWRAGLGGAPILDGCVAQFECVNEICHAGGDHLIFIGRVHRFRTWNRTPLVFCAGNFRSAAAMSKV